MERDERRRADALDRFWDARQRGDSPFRPAGVDKATAQLVDHLSRRPASPDMNTAQLRVRQRIVAAAKTMEDTMHATTLPLQVPGPTARESVGRDRPIDLHPQGGVIRLALAAVLLISLAAGYARFGQGLPDGGEPANIPAAVVLATEPATPAATPAATLYPRADHAIIGTWQWDYAPCNPGFVAYSVFNTDGSYIEYADRHGMSDVTWGITVGTWRATGERSVEVVATDLQLPSFNGMFGFEENLPLPTQPIVESLVSFYAIELDAGGTSFVARGFYEPRGADGEVLVHFDYSDDCGFDMHGLKTVPESIATPTP